MLSSWLPVVVLFGEVLELGYSNYPMWIIPVFYQNLVLLYMSINVHCNVWRVWSDSMFSPSQWERSSSAMFEVSNQSIISAAYIGNWAAFWLASWQHDVSWLPVWLFSGRYLSSGCIAATRLSAMCLSWSSSTSNCWICCSLSCFSAHSCSTSWPNWSFSNLRSLHSSSTSALSVSVLSLSTRRL